MRSLYSGIDVKNRPEFETGKFFFKYFSGTPEKNESLFPAINLQKYSNI